MKAVKEYLRSRRAKLESLALTDFIDSYPDYESMTPDYESIRFEEEEIQGWKDIWLDVISEIAEIEVLLDEDFTQTSLRNELTNLGYYAENLWQIEDVQSSFECSDEEAQEVLNMAMTSDYISSEIWEAVMMAASHLNLKEKEDETNL